MRRALLGIAVLLLLLAGGLYVAATRVLASDYARRALEQQLSGRLGQPVHIARLSAAIYPHVAVDLDDVTVGAPTTVTLAHVRFVTGAGALFSRTISDAELIVRNTRLTLPLPVSLLPANTGTSTPEGPGLTVASIRVLSLDNVELVAPPHVLRVDLQASVTGDRLEIASVSLRGSRSRIQGKGTLSSMGRVEGALEAKADPLDLDELMAIASSLTTTAGDQGQTRERAAPMRLTVSLTATTGQFATYTFADLTTTIQLAAGTVTLAPLALRTSGGQFKGRLEMDTQSPTRKLRLSGRVDGLDVATLMKANGIAGGITGTMGGSVTLSAAGTDAATVLQTAHGTIVAAITNGTIERLDLVRTIVLAFGKPSGVAQEGSGSTFTRLGGTFALANRVVTSDNVSLASRDFDVKGHSRLQLSTGALDARGDVVLSPELTAQAGTDLRRYAQEDGRVIVPATVAGTIEQPRVSVDVQAAAARAFKNEIQRRARTLFEGLLKKKGKGQ
ncbi:MAG: AsmA-like C-terminal region-containing protein [Vicinamibacterales bacterium]